MGPDHIYGRKARSPIYLHSLTPPPTHPNRAQNQIANTFIRIRKDAFLHTIFAAPSHADRTTVTNLRSMGAAFQMPSFQSLILNWPKLRCARTSDGLGLCGKWCSQRTILLGSSQTYRIAGLFHFDITEDCDARSLLSASSIISITSLMPYLAFQPSFASAFDGSTLIFKISVGRIS